MGRDIHELERKGKKGSKRENTEPYLKEQTMITLTTNTRGSTAMEPNFKMMSGPQLIAEYNKMAEGSVGYENDVKPVKRFKDALSGIKRCEALYLLIKTSKEGSVATKGEDLMTTNDDETQETVKEENVAVVEKVERKAKVPKKAATAKKAKTAKKEAAPKKAKAAKEKANGSDVKQEKIAVEFGARPNSYREKLLVTLYSNFRKQVPMSQLLKGVYGNMNTENKGALNMVKKGMLETIKKEKLPYQVKKEKNTETKEISFGLYPNK